MRTRRIAVALAICGVIAGIQTLLAKPEITTVCCSGPGDCGSQERWGVSAEFKAAYRLGGTPATILVGSDGRVQRAWAGAFQGRIETEIESLFGVSLPGLTR